MEYLIAALVFFVLSVFSFIYGVRIGMRVSKGLEPKTVPQMVRDTKERNENQKEAKIQEDFWDAIENNDGYTPEERALMRKGEDE